MRTHDGKVKYLRPSVPFHFVEFVFVIAVVRHAIALVQPVA